MSSERICAWLSGLPTAYKEENGSLVNNKKHTIIEEKSAPISEYTCCPSEFIEDESESAFLELFKYIQDTILHSLQLPTRYLMTLLKLNLVEVNGEASSSLLSTLGAIKLRTLWQIHSYLGKSIETFINKTLLLTLVHNISTSELKVIGHYAMFEDKDIMYGYYIIATGAYHCSRPPNCFYNAIGFCYKETQRIEEQIKAFVNQSNGAELRLHKNFQEKLQHKHNVSTEGDGPEGDGGTEESIELGSSDGSASNDESGGGKSLEWSD